MESQTIDQSPKMSSNEDNNNDSNGVKQPVYDVLGSNDQELAKRHFSDDDLGECDRSETRSNGTCSKTNEGSDDEDDSSEPSNSKDRASVDSILDTVKFRAASDSQQVSNNETSNGVHSKDYDSCSSIDGCPQTQVVSMDDSGFVEKPNHSDEPEQMRKLFIGGIDYKTSEAALKQHFEKFGDVIDCVVMREPQSKRSRGFGFVIYANSSMVDRAQEARPHEVDGREVQSKRAISREDSGKPEAQATVKKVYLGGLSDDIEESELRDYFKDFGTIVNVNIVAHKDTGKRRGFAFVEFDDYDPVDKIVLKKFHIIKDKRIEAKKAIPKVEMDARKRVDPRAAMAGAAMIALSGPPLESGPAGRSRSARNGSACLWDGGPYGGAGAYPAGYSGQANYGYPPHYHPPSAHYGTANGWLLHSNQVGGSPYGGFRGASGSGAYGRNNYANQAAASNWTTTNDYGSFSSEQGAGGPMRLSYQHRGWGPYGGGYGTHRGRGYNP